MPMCREPVSGAKDDIGRHRRGWAWSRTRICSEAAWEAGWRATGGLDAHLTAERYDESTRRLEEAGVEFPPDGLDYHICFGSEGSLRVSEIWDSREQFEAFGARLMPVLADTGIEFSGDPEVFEVHNIIKR